MMASKQNALEKLLQSKTPVHKHVAIAFTDIQDSTGLASELGGDRWKPLRDEHFEIAAAAIRAQQGALVQTVGDSVIAVFDQPSDAVLFALQLQERLSVWNADRPGGPEILVRIGLHCGDVEIGKHPPAGTPDIHGNEVAAT